VNAGTDVVVDGIKGKCRASSVARFVGSLVLSFGGVPLEPPSIKK